MDPQQNQNPAPEQASTETPPVPKAPEPVGAYPHDKKPKTKAIQVIYFLLGFIEFLLGFRLVFRLLGANPESEFMQLVNSFTDPLLSLFKGIFGEAADASRLEPSVIVGMIVYIILAYGATKLVKILTPDETKLV